MRDETGLFERLSLEAFQSGLSWSTILRKREAFRSAFAGFDAETVARFGSADRQRLMSRTDIVRNRAKIEATITNARAVLELRSDPSLSDGLCSLLWDFAPDLAHRPRPVGRDMVEPFTEQSRAMSRELKRRGFVFIGPTTVWSTWQAIGVVDEHFTDCHVSTRTEGVR